MLNPLVDAVRHTACIVPDIEAAIEEWNDFTRPYFDGMHALLCEADDTRPIFEVDLPALAQAE